MLYLVATPIGNLEDLSYRAVKTLQTCDYILCEDTRHSLILLRHYDIKKPLKSYHKFNETSQLEGILADLEQGLTIGLISDAGTPGIADPGLTIIQACVTRQIPVSLIPGPCAIIQALVCSGFETERFQFCGFLPKKAGQLKSTLQEILHYPGISIVYESPHRIQKTLSLLQELASTRALCLARELTKHFEEVCRGTAEVLLARWVQETPRGEMVLLIDKAPPPSLSWENLTPEEHLNFMQTEYGLSRKEAIKAVAELRGVSKREIYSLDLLRN